MPDLQTIVADPDFAQLPPPEQIKAISAVAPEFVHLPPAEQAKVIAHFAPPPNPVTAPLDAAKADAIAKVSPETRAGGTFADLGVAASGLVGAAGGTAIGAAALGPAGAVLGAGAGAAAGTQLGSRLLRGSWAGFWETALSGAAGLVPEAFDQVLNLTGRNAANLDAAIERTTGARVPRSAGAVTDVQLEQQQVGRGFKKAYSQAWGRVEQTKRKLFGEALDSADASARPISTVGIGDASLLDEAQVARTAFLDRLNLPADHPAIRILDQAIQKFANQPTLSVREADTLVKQLNEALPKTISPDGIPFAKSVLNGLKKRLNAEIDNATIGTPAYQKFQEAKQYYDETVRPARIIGNDTFSALKENPRLFGRVLRAVPDRFAKTLEILDTPEVPFEAKTAARFPKQPQGPIDTTANPAFDLKTDYARNFPAAGRGIEEGAANPAQIGTTQPAVRENMAPLGPGTIVPREPSGGPLVPTTGTAVGPAGSVPQPGAPSAPGAAPNERLIGNAADPEAAMKLRVGYAQDLVLQATDELGVVDYRKLAKLFNKENGLNRSALSAGAPAEYTRLFGELDKASRRMEWKTAFSKYGMPIAQAGAAGAGVGAAYHEAKKGNLIESAALLTSGALGAVFLPRLLATPGAARILRRGIQAQDGGNYRAAAKLGAQFIGEIGLQEALTVLQPTPAPVPNPQPTP